MEQLACVKEICETLKTVKDKETADAAAPKVKELAAKMDAVQAKAKDLPEPSDEVKEKLEASLEAQIKPMMQEFVGVLLPLAMGNFYGSEALSAAMDTMLPPQS